MPTKPKVYTIGYSGRKPAQLQALAEKLDATVLDIRFSPRSRNPQWAQKNLNKVLGSRYLHVRQFGNKNYKGGPIALVDYESGRDLVANHPRPAVILLCACKDYDHCHRRTIAEALATEGFEVEEIREPLPEAEETPPKPTITQLSLI